MCLQRHWQGWRKPWLQTACKISDIILYKVHKSSPHGIASGFVTGVDAKFAEDVSLVGIDGVVTGIAVVGNLLNRFSLSRQFEYLDFCLRQFVKRGTAAPL